MTNIRETRTTEHETGSEQRIATFKATQLVWLLLGILEALIALRVLFKLIGTNPENTFAAFLYGITGLFVAPFQSLIGAPSSGGMVLEISSIIAMVVYLLVGWAIERIIYVGFYRPRGPRSVSQTVVTDQIPPVETHISDSQTTTTVRTNDQR
ncbi:MAG: hypothetical protein BGO78_02300 [Chloroflexi bacterium 44-23]|nr:MAG: hypothetical protein BGO78_02300 [Chloroflexi bacterium 44-23]